MPFLKQYSEVEALLQHFVFYLNVNGKELKLNAVIIIEAKLKVRQLTTF